MHMHNTGQRKLISRVTRRHVLLKVIKTITLEIMFDAIIVKTELIFNIINVIFFLITMYSRTTYQKKLQELEIYTVAN